MEPSLNEKESSLRDYLRVIFRQGDIVITTVICVMAAVYLGLQLKTPLYESKVRMMSIAKKYFADSYFKDITDVRSTEITLSQSEMVKSNPVIERAIKRLRLTEQPLDYEKKFSSPLKAILIDLMEKSREKNLKRYSESERNEIIFRMKVQDLKKMVKVDQVKETNLFTITVSDFSPTHAAILANVISRSYCIFDLEQQLSELQQRYGEKHLMIMQLKDNIQKMIDSLGGDPLSNIEAIGPASVKVIEQATVAFEPTGLPKPAILALALALSLFLGIVLAFGLENLDSALKTPEEIRQALGVSFLGYLPKINPLSAKILNFLRKVLNIVVGIFVFLLVLRILASALRLDQENSIVQFLFQATNPLLDFTKTAFFLNKVSGLLPNAILILSLLIVLNLIFSKILTVSARAIKAKALLISKAKKNSPYLRAYQNLSEQIIVSLKGNEQKSALMLSFLPKEGNSLILANLGSYLADKAGQKILLVDANLRNPRLHKIFKLNNELGLVELLKGAANFAETVQVVSENLSVLPCGNSSLAKNNLFDFSLLPGIIKETEKKFSFILFDCANLKNFKDALAIAAHLDTVILVINEGKTRKEVAKAAILPLEEKRTNFLGAILNNRTFAIPKLIYDRT